MLCSGEALGADESALRRAAAAAAEEEKTNVRGRCKAFRAVISWDDLYPLIADPSGWQPDEEGWKSLYENRARDFTTTFAFGATDKKDIGFDGQREPRFFSDAVKEAGFQDEILKQERDIDKSNPDHRTLSVRVGTVAAAKAVIDNGADVVYGHGPHVCRGMEVYKSRFVV